MKGEKVSPKIVVLSEEFSFSQRKLKILAVVLTTLGEFLLTIENSVPNFQKLVAIYPSVSG